MTEYIIELETKIDGEWKKAYHELLASSNRTDTMNAYEEHITFNKKQAKRFYQEEEANKFAVLLTGTFQRAKVVPLKKK